MTKKYHVDYRGLKHLFQSAKDFYDFGEKIQLKYGPIASDTNYIFYVDGKRIVADPEKDTFVIEFTMPDHDIEVYAEKNSSMTRRIVQNIRRPAVLAKNDQSMVICPSCGTSVLDAEYCAEYGYEMNRAKLNKNRKTGKML